MRIIVDGTAGIPFSAFSGYTETIFRPKASDPGMKPGMKRALPAHSSTWMLLRKGMSLIPVE